MTQGTKTKSEKRAKVASLVAARARSFGARRRPWEWLRFFFFSRSEVGVRIRELQSECFSFRFVLFSLLLSHSPEHAGPEDRAREARPDGAADAQRLVRRAAREEQVAFPSVATGSSSNGRLLVVAVLAAGASSSSCCYSPCLLLLLPRRRRSRDVSRRASRGGDGQQQGFHAFRRHLFSLGKEKNAFSFVSLSRFFRFTHKPFIFFLSLSLSFPFRCIAINKSTRTEKQIKPGSCRRSGPPRPSPRTPCR